jgi:hypothetical protein
MKSHLIVSKNSNGGIPGTRSQDLLQDYMIKFSAEFIHHIIISLFIKHNLLCVASHALGKYSKEECGHHRAWGEDRG